MGPQPTLNVFWTMLGRIVAAFMSTRAHVQITIILKDGVIQPVHVSQSYAPGDLPKV
jgi:hypothetical protein